MSTATALTQPSRELRKILEPFTGLVAARELALPRASFAGAVMRSWPVEDGKYEQRSNGDMVAITPMLAATTAFRARYDGELVDIDLNTRVAVGHAIALAHPDCFAPLDGFGLHARMVSAAKVAAWRARARSATSTAARSRGAGSLYLGSSQSTVTTPKLRPASATATLPQYRVALRDTQSRTKVSLSEFAYEVIERECMRLAHIDGVETGGLLAAMVARSWDTQINVSDARGPGPKSEHGVNALRIDLTGDVQLERDFAWAENNTGEAGQWHSHPSGGTTPSPADLDTWADSLRYTSENRGNGLYLGIIATPRKQRGRWNFPKLTAYIMRRGERDRFVCEPAAVTVRSVAGGGW